MKCQYCQYSCNNSAELEAIREVVPDGVLGSTMGRWQGFICLDCFEKLKSIKRHLPKSTITFRGLESRTWDELD